MSVPVHVRIWFPKPRSGSPGHADLIVGDGGPIDDGKPHDTYLSPYPAGTSILQFVGNMTIGGPRTDMVKKAPPDRVVVLYGMDTDAIKEKISEIQRTRGYSLVGSDNCSSQVGECLMAGDSSAEGLTERTTLGMYKFVPGGWGYHFALYGTPLNLLAYVTGLAKRFPPSKDPLPRPQPPMPAWLASRVLVDPLQGMWLRHGQMGTLLLFQRTSPLNVDPITYKVLVDRYRGKYAIRKYKGLEEENIRGQFSVKDKEFRGRYAFMGTLNTIVLKLTGPTTLVDTSSSPSLTYIKIN